ncbi:DNA-(apurinic or apyrimidinic site) lyase [mine drainage metagenome]|uniref:DNA-(Apurinic or apyrimidinic site) lyase n=1 Tax=mine drainage metagenome TaxID=410659 RepID=T1BYW3_9ZZZZ
MTRTPALDWERVMDRLSSFYGRGDWRVPYLRDHAEDPFQVLIGTVLSQRTRDEATDVASAQLFARYPDPRFACPRPSGTRGTAHPRNGVLSSQVACDPQDRSGDPGSIPR